MKMAQLRKTLSSYERLLEETKADTELRAELTRLNSWLSQFDKLDVAEVCSTAGVPEPPPRSKAAPRTEVDSALVEEYSARLAASASDRTAFEGAVSDMKVDKRVRVTEASEIAQRYVGGTSKYKSKPDALKEIKLRFEASLRATQRLRAASEIY